MFDPFSTFEDHVSTPRGRGVLPDGGVIGAAGGSSCGDMLTVGIACEGGVIAAAGFDADGCAALTAAGSAVVELVRGVGLLDAARIGREEIDAELGGVSAERAHVNVLAEEALHRALGALVVHADSDLLEPAGNRKLVGLSGGVDSAVAAELLKGAGDEAVGITLQLWDDPATDGTASCCSPQAVTLARRLAHDLNMPHFTVDLRDPFRKGVVDPYLAAFGDGLTPNPCVGCNGHVRFDALDEMRQRLGASKLATGHYARIEWDEDGPLLAAATDENKDQTYMLAAVEPRIIEHLEFPLGLLTKPEVRERARAAGLAVAEKPESQDLCFLAGIGRDGFLERHSGRADEPGPIRNRAGHEVGRHRGAYRFTVGQRRGLGLAAPHPLYVLDVDPSDNAVTVGTIEDLQTTSVRLIGVRLLRDGSEVDRVKLRYRNAPTACNVQGDAPAGRHRELRIELEIPVAGAAPGQVACLMRGETVVGWATIARPLANSNAKLSGDEFPRDPRDIPVVL
ncbi:MAG: tRNA 2-thiouridine(34) synthase MnmA [Solirubrobacterales bacterium]|nr:tRNA 2-thiouridine(34) synthase MnmA [Solirubrobacterales bacterium]